MIARDEAAGLTRAIRVLAVSKGTLYHKPHPLLRQMHHFLGSYNAVFFKSHDINSGM